MEEGIKEGIKEAIHKMSLSGIDNATIANILQLTTEEVNKMLQ